MSVLMTSDVVIKSDARRQFSARVRTLDQQRSTRGPLLCGEERVFL